MKILLLLSLCLFAACNGSSGSSSNKSSPPIVVIEPEPEIPVIDEPEVLSIIFDSIPNLTKNLNINIKANVSENLSILKIYKEETCSISPVDLTKTQLQAGASFTLSTNKENVLYYKALDFNNFESVMCQEFKRVVHDNLSPDPVLGSYLFAQNGLNTSELSFLTGGEAIDVSLDAALFNYYRREGSEFVFVGSGTRSVYLAKQIIVQLKENEINNIYLKIIDNAGNESDYSSNGVFINQTTSAGALPKPILYSDLENMNFKTTNLDKVNIKGIVSFQTQSVLVYSDASLTNLIATIPANVYNTNGIELNLDANIVTNIFLVSANASIQSQAIQFSTTYDTIAPSTPVLDDDYFFVEGDVYEFGPQGDSTGPLRGLVTSSDLAKIYVYTDSALTQLHNFSAVDPENFAWEVTLTLQLGSNDFYIVAEDFAGNRSASIKRTFTSEIVSQ